MSTNDKTKITATFATRAFGIIALLGLAGITSTLHSAAAQPMPQDNGMPDGFGQTTTTSLDEESRRLTILGALGISLVEDVKVTSIALNEDSTEVTVTLSSAGNATATTASFDIGNNQTSTADDTETPGVTVAAFRTQLDLIGMLQGHMAMGASPPEMTADQGTMQGGDITMHDQGGMGAMHSGSKMPMFDIMSFIESLEIGSNIENEGWTSPADVTVPVISSEGSTAENSIMNNTTTSTGASDTEVVVIVVIPYTGETENEVPPIEPSFP